MLATLTSGRLERRTRLLIFFWFRDNTSSQSFQMTRRSAAGPEEQDILSRFETAMEEEETNIAKEAARQSLTCHAEPME